MTTANGSALRARAQLCQATRMSALTRSKPIAPAWIVAALRGALAQGRTIRERYARKSPRAAFCSLRDCGTLSDLGIEELRLSASQHGYLAGGRGRLLQSPDRLYLVNDAPMRCDTRNSRPADVDARWV